MLFAQGAETGNAAVAFASVFVLLLLVFGGAFGPRPPQGLPAERRAFALPRAGGAGRLASLSRRSFVVPVRRVAAGLADAARHRRRVSAVPLHGPVPARQRGLSGGGGLLR